MDCFDSIFAVISGTMAALLVGWSCVSAIVGGAMLIRDGNRLRHTRPRPDLVKAYADRLQALHGQDAFRRNGEAMQQARESADFQRHRFLREVSAELARRLATD